MRKKGRRFRAGLCAVALVVGMLPSTGLAAQDSSPEKLEPSGNQYAIPALTLTADCHYTVLVVRKGAVLDSLSADDIMYIGQALADENGQVQFPGFALREETDAYVYIGGETLDLPEQHYYIEADPSKVLEQLEIATLPALTIPKTGEVHSEVPSVTAIAASGADMTPPSLAWSIDNGPFVGISINEDSGVLTITGLASPSKITIRAAYGKVSATQTVVVNGRESSPAPDATVSGMPTSITLPYEGGDIPLSVAENTTYTYQWQRETGNGIWNDLVNEIAPTYLIPADQVKAANNGWRFRCNVTNQEGDLRPNTTSQAVTLVVKKGPQAAPTDLVGIAPTTVGGSDGKITGLDPTKTYTKKGGTDITASTVPANSTEITGLKAGSYQIKIKASDDYTESREAKIVVPERSADMIPVADITGVPTAGTAGTALPLTGAVSPENATYQTIVWSIVDPGTTGAVLTGAVLTTVRPGTLRLKATVAGGLQDGDYTQEFDLTISEAPPEAYPVIIQVNKDGQPWDGHGKIFTLKQGGVILSDLSFVQDGVYEVLENGGETGVSVTVSGGTATAAVDYDTVFFAALDMGLANGSGITARYNGAVIQNNQVVLKGGRLVLTTVGAGADRYSYQWSSGENMAELTVDRVDAKVNLTCTVTGSREIGGSVTIQGQPKYGEQLTAGTADLESAAAIADLAYTWSRGSEVLGTGRSYTLTQSDISTKVTLTVAGTGNYYGTLSVTSDTIGKADQTAPAHVDKLDETAQGAEDGALTGLTADMEYQRSGGTGWTPCPNGTVTGLAPGAYLVRYRESETHHAGVSVTLRILAFDALAPAETPRASFDAGTMCLTGIAGMKYSVDGGAHWLEASGDIVDLGGVALSPATGLQVYQPGDGVATSDSDIQYIVLTKAPAPGELSKRDVSAQGERDGMIRNVTEDMEYRAVGDTLWTACTGTQITDLAAGEYLVRVTGVGTSLPSEAVAVTIAVSSRIVSVTGVQLSRNSLSFYSNTGVQSKQLTAVVLPESATDQAVTWRSTNTTVASVDQWGLVTVEGNGSASILATTRDGGFTDTCTITVRTYNGDDGSGDWGDDDGGNRPSVPERTHKVVVATAEGTTTMTIPVAKDQDRVTVDRTAANRLAAAAAESGSSKMVIAAQDQALPVELTEAALDAVWGRQGASLTIKSGAAEITLTKDQTDLSPGVLTVDSKRDKNGWVTISVKKGGKDVARPILVALPAGEGNVALALRPDGTESPVPFSRITDGVMYAAVDGSAVLRVEQRGGFFADTKGHWAEREADFAAAHGLFQGIDRQTFGPNRTVTRGMLMTVLYRMADTPIVTEEPRFPDVAPGSWYEQAVGWGAETGLASGVEDGRFQPDSDTSRAQFATLLYRFAQTLDMNTTTGSTSLATFIDGGQVEAWSADALTWAVSQGIMQGRDNGTLGSHEPVTRAEAAAMLERFISARLR